MGTTTQTRRRRWGVAFLGLAVVMLIAGETVLRNSLKGLSSVIFWLLCFFFTILAILAALRDLASVRQRTREEQRALIQDTLTEIARQEKNRGQPPKTGDSH